MWHDKCHKSDQNVIPLIHHIMTSVTDTNPVKSRCPISELFSPPHKIGHIDFTFMDFSRYVTAKWIVRVAFGSWCFSILVDFGHGAIRVIFSKRIQLKWCCAFYFICYIHILVTEKLDCQESTPIVIKEEPQKEESESQNLLKDKTCLDSEDTKNTSGKSIFKSILYSKFCTIEVYGTNWRKFKTISKRILFVSSINVHEFLLYQILKHSRAFPNRFTIIQYCT